MFKKLLVILLIGGGIYYYWTTRPITHGPGVIAPDSPKQTKRYNEKNLSLNGIDIADKADITMEARVLDIATYDDAYSDLTATDVVFGWGPMSDEVNLDKIKITQSNRTYDINMGRPPIEPREMWKHTENMHLIAPTKEIKDKISSFHVGNIVSIEGYIVNAKSPSGWALKSSLKRGDHGAGSSELVWIKSLRVL